MPVLTRTAGADAPVGAQVQWGHPLARGLLLCFPGNARRCLATGIPAVPSDGTGPILASPRGTSFTSASGASLHFPGHPVQSITDSVTIVLGKWRSSGGQATSAAFGTRDGGGGRMGAHMPWNDGNIYFDFGNFVAPNRLTVAVGTEGDDVFALRAGRNGGGVWKNGVLIGSQSSAVTRSGTTDGFYLGNYNGSGAEVGETEARYAFCYVYRRELLQHEIEEISVDPWVILRPPRRFTFLASAAGSTFRPQFIIT